MKPMSPASVITCRNELVINVIQEKNVCMNVFKFNTLSSSFSSILVHMPLQLWCCIITRYEVENLDGMLIRQIKKKTQIAITSSVQT